MLNVLQVKKSFMAEELKLGDITGFSNWVILQAFQIELKLGL